MKILILGAGQVGSTVAENLVGEANDITIVDSDGEKLHQLQDRLDLRTVVGNAAHPFAGTPGKIKADYDSFWLENDGLAHADGFYDLPPHEPLRDIQEVDSKHRSAFRKREALREEATRLLWQALAETPPLAMTG